MTLDGLIETLCDLRIDLKGETPVKLVRTNPDGSREPIDLTLDQVGGAWGEIVFDPNAE